MRKTITCLTLATLCLALPMPVHADTVFQGGNLNTLGNWDDGAPTSSNPGIMNVDGSFTGNQSSPWLVEDGAALTVGGDSVLTFTGDFAVDGAFWVINNATINCSDDFFVGRSNGTVTLNAGSVTTCADDWETNDYGGRITVNGGTHNSGTGTSNNVGAQNKTGVGIDFLGGTVTAGNFRFQGVSTSSVGGSAILASASATTTFSDDSGTIDFLSGWTGSWEVGSFGAGTWEARLISAANGFQLDGATIDAASFAANFSVSPDGTTLTMVPEPATMSLLALGGIAMLKRRKK